jgi:hypothetical protein
MRVVNDSTFEIRSVSAMSRWGTALWVRRSSPHNAVRDIGFSGNARSCDFYIHIHIPLSIIDYYTIV